MKKLFFALLLIAGSLKAASPYYTPAYEGSNGYPVIWLGGGRQSQTNPAAFRALIGVTSGGGATILPNPNQLETNSVTGMLTIIPDSLQTNDVIYSGAVGSAKKAADFELRRLYNSSGTAVIIDWEAGLFYDSGGVVSVNAEAHTLANASGVGTVDYEAGSLIDSTTAPSASWETRQLFYPDGATPSMNWEDGVVNDSSGQTSLDYLNREGLDSNGQTSFSWQGRNLLDSLLVDSINWENRKLYLSSGSGAYSLDWQNKILISTTTSMDWGLRRLYDSGIDVSIDYQNRVLFNETGGTNIDYRSYALKDNGNQLSVGWSDRSLYDTTGTESMNWTTRTFNGTGWKFLTATNHTDVSAGAYVLGGGFFWDGTRFTNGVPRVTAAGAGSLSNHIDVSATAFLDGGFLKYSGTTFTTVRLTNTFAGFTKDGAGGTLSSGQVSGAVTMAHAGTITGWSISAGGTSPTCTIDVWKIATGTALPTVSNTIMGTKPALSTGNVVRSSALTGWTATTYAAGDIIIFNVDATANATWITFALEGY